MTNLYSLSLLDDDDELDPYVPGASVSGEGQFSGLFGAVQQSLQSAPIAAPGWTPEEADPWTGSQYAPLPTPAPYGGTYKSPATPYGTSAPAPWWQTLPPAQTDAIIGQMNEEVQPDYRPYIAPPPPEEYDQPNVAPEEPGFLAKLFSSIAGRGRGAASNAVLSDAWIPSGGPMGLRDFRTPSEVYNTEIPVVSPFMRETVRPAVGDLAELATAPLDSLSFPARQLLGLDNDDMTIGDVARVGAQAVVPVTLGDFILEAAPGVGDARGIASLVRSGGLDDAARVMAGSPLVTGTKQVARNLADPATLRLAGAAAPDVGRTVAPSALLPGGVPRVISPTEGEALAPIAGGARKKLLPEQQAAAAARGATPKAGTTPPPAAGAATPAAPIGAPGLGRLASAPPPAQPPSISPTGTGGADFAANIRLSKYPEDVRAPIKKWADANPDAVQAARRGVRSDAQVLADARALVEETGGDFAKMQRQWKPGEAWNAEEVTAIRGTLRAKTNAVLEAAKVAKADNSAANHAALLLAMEDQAQVQGIVHGVTAESGRALRAFRQEAFDAATSGNTRKLEELLKRTVGSDRGKLDALADRIAALDLGNPAEVNAFIRSAQKPKASDYIMELWINSILSGPKTHIINSISNASYAMMSLPERAMAAAVDLPLSKLQGRPVARFFEEVPADAYGAVSGISEGVRAAAKTMRDGFTPAQASKWEFRRTAIPGLPGRIIRMPGTALEAADSLFYSINYRAALNAGAVRIAKTERLKGADLVARIADLKLDPPQSLIAQATKDAEYRLFRSEPGSIAQGFMSLRDKIPGGRFILPFLRTPANLLGAGMERSPLGLLNRELWHNLATKNPEASDQIGRIILGSGIAAGFGAMVADGTIDITGAPPTNAAARDRFYREGKVPYGLKIGGKWIQFQRLEPYSQTLGQLAAVTEAVRNKDNATAEQIASQMAATLGNNLINQTYFSGLSDFMDALSDPAGYGSRFATRTAGGFVPFSSALRTAAQVTDPVYRDPKTLPERFKANLPGLSSQVPPRLTAFGEEARQRSSPVSPIQVTMAQQSAVDAELERLGMEVGFVGASIAGIPLDRSLQADYQRGAGQNTSVLLSALVQSEAWQTLNDGQKTQLIEKAVTASRDRVRDPISDTIGNLFNSDAFKALTPAQQKELRESESLKDIVRSLLAASVEAAGVGQ